MMSPWLLTSLNACDREALYAMLVSLGASKMMAARLMQDSPQCWTACQAIVDFASDAEGDVRGASPGSSWRKRSDAGSGGASN
jgi:hypothetical protein